MREPSGADPLPVALKAYWRCRHWMVLAFALTTAAGPAQAQPMAFVPSYVPSTRDADKCFMGGTEIGTLVAHDGKLFAGNGYWKDVPGSGGTPGAQVLVLDGPGARWHVDATFDDPLPGGRQWHLAVSALAEATFRTDRHGRPLSLPSTVLVASTWDVTGTRTVFVRNDATATWSGTVLTRDPPTKDFLPQVRTFGTHRDRLTGADRASSASTPRREQRRRIWT